MAVLKSPNPLRDQSPEVSSSSASRRAINHGVGARRLYTLAFSCRLADHRLVGRIGREVPQRASSMLLLHIGAVARERDQRPDAARLADRRLVGRIVREGRLPRFPMYRGGFSP